MLVKMHRNSSISWPDRASEPAKTAVLTRLLSASLPSSFPLEADQFCRPVRATTQHEHCFKQLELRYQPTLLISIYRALSCRLCLWLRVSVWVSKVGQLNLVGCTDHGFNCIQCERTSNCCRLTQHKRSTQRVLEPRDKERGIQIAWKTQLESNLCQD